MIVEDRVTCEGCGAEITHIVTAGCGSINLSDDPDYYLCDSCIAERDGRMDELDRDDSMAVRTECSIARNHNG